jgi:hypothetical protein
VTISLCRAVLLYTVWLCLLLCAIDNKIVLRNTSLSIHARSSQSAPYTIDHVAQHAMLRNMIDRVWAPLYALYIPVSNAVHITKRLHLYAKEYA